MLDAPTPEAAAAGEATEWLSRLAEALERRDATAAAALLHRDGAWRDLLCFTWTIGTQEDRAAAEAMLRATLDRATPGSFRLTRAARTVEGSVEAWFAFETALARCEGIARLRDGLAETVLTVMTELKGFEEPLGPRRPVGAEHRAQRGRETWSDRRRRDAEAWGRERQPYCLIIGGGQGGLMLGARLKMLGVPTLIVEKNARIGDSWRNRYRSLVLHDPVWYDHLPYIPFPESWPVFTPKDKMGAWLEHYAEAMELDCWTSSSVVSARFDATARRWTVEVEREGGPETLTPAQLVFATGAYGPPRRLDIPGLERFRGVLQHSSEYQDGAAWKGKRAVVIGAASSAHDVALDLWEAGAEVTMVQRSPTTVVKSETLMELGFDTYSESAVARGVTVDVADMLAAATPFSRMPPGQKALYDRIRERDAAFYADLEASGFAIDFGEDETGLMMKALRTGSGYYIDVGASQLIIDREIRLRSGVGIRGLTETGVILDDGSELPADLVVACVGYQSMHETVAALVDRETADRVGPCWGLGSGVKGDPGPWVGEPRNMWRPTAQEALWFHGGNLALSRFYSRLMALQLKARMEGIGAPVYAPAPRG